MVTNQFKNSLVTIGDQILLSAHYVPVTQKYFEDAVTQAKSFDFSGNIELAFQKTISMDENDNVSSYLEITEEKTTTAKNQSDKLQAVANVGDKLSQITSYASVIPGLQVLKSISLVLRGLSMASYGSAAAITMVRYINIVKETEPSLSESMHPHDFLKKTLIVNERYLDNFRGHYTAQRLHANENQLLTGINDYLAILEEISGFIMQENKADAMEMLPLLMEADQNLNDHLTQSQAPIWAAAEVSFEEDEIFGELYAGLNSMVNKSQAERIILYSDLLEYIINNEFQQGEFASVIDSIRDSFEGTESLIQILGELISDVAVPPMIIVNHSVIDRNVVGQGETFVLNASIKNVGFADAENVNVVLKVDSSASIISEGSYTLENVGIDEVKNLSWTIRQDEILETASFYNIKITSDNAKGMSGGGTYLTGNTSLYNSSRNLSSVPNIKLVVFPNPASEYINIIIPVSERNNIYSIKVFNVPGDIVFSEKKASGDIYRLERNDLPPGFYMIELLGNNKYQGSFILE